MPRLGALPQTGPSGLSFPKVIMKVTEWMSACLEQAAQARVKEDESLKSQKDHEVLMILSPLASPRSRLCWVTFSLPKPTVALCHSLSGGSWIDYLVHAWSPPVQPTPCWSLGLSSAMLGIGDRGSGPPHCVNE